jgi:hypothetical protein
MFLNRKDPANFAFGLKPLWISNAINKFIIKIINKIKNTMQKIKMLLTATLLMAGMTTAFGQTSKAVVVATPGTLKDQLTAIEKTTVTDFTVRGNINAQDIQFMRDSLTVLAHLDLSSSVIHAYTGADGTTQHGISRNYPVNEMPISSFCNPVTKIGKTTLTSVVLPLDLISIGESAFAGCTRLTSVTFHVRLASIGKSAFSGCTGLSLNAESFPAGLSSIGESAFSGCTGLSSLTLPVGLTSIAGNAFADCSLLISVTFNAVNCVEMGVGSSSFVPVFSNCPSFTTLTIGENVQTIPSYAFADCSKLTTVRFNAVNCGQMGLNDGTSVFPVFYNCPALATLIIGNDVQTIPDNAFADCSKLTALQIPASVISIGDYAFAGCSGLKSVTLKDNLMSIGSYAFSECSGLTTITLPANLTSVGGSAFSDCSQLTRVNFNAENCVEMGTKESDVIYPVFKNCHAITTLNIGTNVQTIPDYAFWGLYLLTGTLTLPDKITSIGDYAFAECSLLESVVFPVALTSLGKNAFENCRGLASIVLPADLTSIGTKAFNNCNELNHITNHRTMPVTIQANVFDGVNKSACTLKVASSSLTQYKNAAVWKTFFVTDEKDGNDDGNGNGNGNNNNVGIENVSGDAIVVYPNPAQDVVRLSGLSGKEDITLYDISGRTVFTSRSEGVKQMQIPVNSLSSGMYFVRISTPTTTKILKVVKE